MRAIKGKDTRPELSLRKRLYHLGFRYRIGPADLPGKPDIFLPKYSATIFINGCFWHGHGCYLFKVPGTRQAFWSNKISATIERDGRKINELRTLGYRVLVVWECAVRGKKRLDMNYLIDKTANWICSENPLSFIDETGINTVQDNKPPLLGCLGRFRGAHSTTGK